MKQVALAILFLSLSPWCLANWNDAQLIQALYPQGNADEIVVLQASYNGTGCSGPNGKYLMLTGHANFKAIYSLLLVAHMTGTPVNLHLAEGFCTASGYSKITLAISGTFN